MSRLNSRFRSGAPSDDLHAAGVLVRIFEGMGGRHAAAWEPCRDDEFCARAGDRPASSIVNAKMPHLFSFDAPGMVVNPKVARLLCSYHGDGNDFMRFCRPPTEWLKMAVEHEPDGSCVPGCTSRFGWCDDRYKPCPLCEEVKCAWRPSCVGGGGLGPDCGLKGMMEAHAAKLLSWASGGQGCVKSGHYGRSRCHNEVVLDAAAWDGAMPGAIEAIFYQRASTAESVAWAKTLHADFIKRYGAASLPPLVVYDHGRVEAPFSLSA